MASKKGKRREERSNQRFRNDMVINSNENLLDTSAISVSMTNGSINVEVPPMASSHIGSTGFVSRSDRHQNASGSFSDSSQCSSGLSSRIDSHQNASNGNRCNQPQKTITCRLKEILAKIKESIKRRIQIKPSKMKCLFGLLRKAWWVLIILYVAYFATDIAVTLLSMTSL